MSLFDSFPFMDSRLGEASFTPSQWALNNPSLSLDGYPSEDGIFDMWKLHWYEWYWVGMVGWSFEFGVGGVFVLGGWGLGPFGQEEDLSLHHFTPWGWVNTIPKEKLEGLFIGIPRHLELGFPFPHTTRLTFSPSLPKLLPLHRLLSSERSAPGCSPRDMYCFHRRG